MENMLVHIKPLQIWVLFPKAFATQLACFGKLTRISPRFVVWHSASSSSPGISFRQGLLSKWCFDTRQWAADISQVSVTREAVHLAVEEGLKLKMVMKGNLNWQQFSHVILLWTYSSPFFTSSPPMIRSSLDFPFPSTIAAPTKIRKE